jgi:hypothetical protein
MEITIGDVPDRPAASLDGGGGGGRPGDGPAASDVVYIFLLWGVDSPQSGSYLVCMATTVRQSITLTKPQYDFLNVEAERLGITVSDLIRRIVDQYREGR